MGAGISSSEGAYADGHTTPAGYDVLMESLEIRGWVSIKGIYVTKRKMSRDLVIREEYISN